MDDIGTIYTSDMSVIWVTMLSSGDMVMLTHHWHGCLCSGMQWPMQCAMHTNAEHECRNTCHHLLMVHVLNMARCNSCMSTMPSGQNTRLPVWQCICACINAGAYSWIGTNHPDVTVEWELKKINLWSLAGAQDCSWTACACAVDSGSHQQSVSHSGQGTHHGITASQWGQH